MVKKNFKDGEIVWARFEDFPYWPARIASDEVLKQLRELKDEDGIAVLFFGKELTYGLVNKQHVKNFKSHLDEYQKVKLSKADQADFEEALNIALNNNDFVDPPLEILEEDRPAKKQKKNKAQLVEKKLTKNLENDCVIEDNNLKEEDKVNENCSKENISESLDQEKINDQSILANNIQDMSESGIKIQDEVAMNDCENIVKADLVKEKDSSNIENNVE